VARALDTALDSPIRCFTEKTPKSHRASPPCRNDLRRVDMNLLVLFKTLMFEKNLTRAGEKLCLGQRAVSAALARPLYCAGTASGVEL